MTRPGPVPLAVLDNSENERERARAWNTLCAVELASLAPVDSMAVCNRAISEDENLAAQSRAGDTVYLTNASEVALSLLQMQAAEDYLDRANRHAEPGQRRRPLDLQALSHHEPGPLRRGPGGTRPQCWSGASSKSPSSAS